MTEDRVPPTEGTKRRSTMGPVLVVALATGALLAVAGDRPWLSVDGAPQPSAASGQQVVTPLDLAVRNPGVTALALVALAALGVVLVTRGRVRRAVAVLALLAAAGTAAGVLGGWLRLEAGVADELAAGPYADAGTSWTGWAWAALPAAVLLVAACALALRDVGRWPEMGRRYDAPTARAATDPGPRVTAESAAPEDRSALDLWKAMDQGHDPTSDERP